MKKFAIIVLFSAFFTGAYGQANFDSKEKEQASKNKVKRQIEWAYDYVNGKPGSKGYKSSSKVFDRNGNTVESCTFKSTGDTLSKMLYKYDAQGNKISYIRYYKGDMIYSLSIRYDIKGRKLSETGINGDPRYGGLPFNNTFTYDSNGRLVEIKYTENKILNERRIFKSSGNSLEMTILSPTGSVTGKETFLIGSPQNPKCNEPNLLDNIGLKSNYEYDQSGKKIEETKVRNGNIDTRTIYSYDSNCNLLQINEETNGKVLTSYQYKYDAQGNVIEEKWSKEGGSASKRSNKYDTKGLRTEMEYYNTSSKITSFSKFTYEFF